MKNIKQGDILYIVSNVRKKYTIATFTVNEVKPPLITGINKSGHKDFLLENNWNWHTVFPTLEQATVYIEEDTIRVAKERIHILEGLKKAVQNIETVVDVIKKSESLSATKTELKKKLDFSDKQAAAIINMKIGKLNLSDIDKEYKELCEMIRGH